LKKLSEKHVKIQNNTLDLQRAELAAKKSAKGPEVSEDEKTSEMLDPDIKAYLVIERSNRVVQLTKTPNLPGPQRLYHRVLSLM